MPLITQVIRNGQPLELAWGDFHIAAMITAVSLDTGEGPFKDNTWRGIIGVDEPQPVNITRRLAFLLSYYTIIGSTVFNDERSYTLKGEYTFIDASDGERFTLEPGDELVMYRSF